jgi:precorrin-2/cobalt-factor-2 C20-methyltransferase
MKQGFADVPVQIIPGVSSVHAAAARAGVPIAHLEDTVAILPAVYGLDRLPRLLADFTTVVLLKVHSVFDTLLDALAALTDPPDAVYLENVGMTGERIVTDLPSLRGQKLPYFSLVLLRRRARRET